jgi:hypothetical protein
MGWDIMRKFGSFLVWAAIVVVALTLAGLSYWWA